MQYTKRQHERAINSSWEANNQIDMHRRVYVGTTYQLVLAHYDEQICCRRYSIVYSAQKTSAFRNPAAAFNRSPPR